MLGCVGPTKMRVSVGPRVEAYFCLAFLFLFQQWKKKEEKNTENGKY
jgi:hypothetical protein